MKRKLLSLILALSLILSCTVNVFAAENESEAEAEEVIVFTETIEINTVDEFLDFAKKCTLDSWSQNKQFILNTDISLAGTNFLPIPTFGGSFEGNGHTISGFSVSDRVVPAGLFSYLQPSAVVKDLNVTGMLSVKQTNSAADGTRNYTLKRTKLKLVFAADRNVFVAPFFAFGSENGYKAKS